MYFASREIPFCAAEDLQVFLSDTFDRLLRLLTIKDEAERRQRTSRVLDDLLFLCDNVKRWPVNRREKMSLRRHVETKRPRTILAGVDALEEFRGNLKGRNEEGETSLSMAEAIRQFISAKTVSESLNALSKAFEGFHPDFGKAEDDIFFADPPFIQLSEYAKQYEDDYDSFIEDIEVAKETLVRVPPFESDDRGEDLSKNPLHLMTALRAKGKEFDKVILLDVEDKMWPNINAKSEEQKEAERRVFYVAFTRAREQVTMLLRKGAVPSPYIQELGL